MNDMTKVIEPRSDQLNSDDLIPGPRTITIREVAIKSGEQPVSMFYDGDNGKPYKPCKSMARVLVAAWGADANKYVGRSLTLYRDPKVKWGGMEVGGIRISHMSHIPGDMVMALTETKGKRAPFKVMPLKMADAPQQSAQPGNGQQQQSATVGFVTEGGDIKDYPRNLGGLESYVGDFEKAFHAATDKAAWFADNQKMFHELAVGATGSRSKSERCEKLAARFDAVATMIGETLGAAKSDGEQQADENKPNASPPTITHIPCPMVEGNPHWKGWHDLALPAIGLLSPAEVEPWRAAHAAEIDGLAKVAKKLAGEVEAALQARVKEA